jgi:hypothetical protein
MSVSAAVTDNISVNDLKEILPIQPTPLPKSCPTSKVWPLKRQREQRRHVGRPPWFLL